LHFLQENKLIEKWMLFAGNVAENIWAEWSKQQ